MNINKELDIAKTAAFLHKDAAFLAPLLCQLNVMWSEDTETACVDGINFKINPKFFKSLNKNEKKGLILHELWHIARLHIIREGDRDHYRWNLATDYIINNDLIADGYVLPKGCLKGKFYKMSEEEAYDALPENPEIELNMPDLVKSEGKQESNASAQILAVSAALQQAKQAGYSSQGIEELLKNLTAPVLDWRKLLENWFQDLVPDDYTWRRPNKRFQNIYLPSIASNENRLSHIMFFLDTSGSISKEQLQQFNSEIAYIKQEYNPELLTLVEFDYRVQKITEIREEDSPKFLKVHGRGGTSYAEVADLIEKKNPLCAVIFTDLCAEPMRKPKASSKILWVISDNKENAPFGKSIHI